MPGGRSRVSRCARGAEGSSSKTRVAFPRLPEPCGFPADVSVPRGRSRSRRASSAPRSARRPSELRGGPGAGARSAASLREHFAYLLDAGARGGCRRRLVEELRRCAASRAQRRHGSSPAVTTGARPPLTPSSPRVALMYFLAAHRGRKPCARVLRGLQRFRLRPRERLCPVAWPACRPPPRARAGSGRPRRRDRGRARLGAPLNNPVSPAPLGRLREAGLVRDRKSAPRPSTR